MTTPIDRHIATVSLPITPRKLIILMNGPDAPIFAQLDLWYDQGLLTAYEAVALLLGREVRIHDQEDVAPVLVDLSVLSIPEETQL